MTHILKRILEAVAIALLVPPAILLSLLPDEESKRRPSNAFDSPEPCPWGPAREMDRRFIGGNP